MKLLLVLIIAISAILNITMAASFKMIDDEKDYRMKNGDLKELMRRRFTAPAMGDHIENLLNLIVKRAITAIGLELILTAKQVQDLKGFNPDTTPPNIVKRDTSELREAMERDISTLQKVLEIQLDKADEAMKSQKKNVEEIIKPGTIVKKQVVTEPTTAPIPFETDDSLEDAYKAYDIIDIIGRILLTMPVDLFKGYGGLDGLDGLGGSFEDDGSFHEYK